MNLEKHPKKTKTWKHTKKAERHPSDLKGHPKKAKTREQTKKAEERLKAYREQTQTIPKEENIQKAIQKSKEAFYLAQQEHILPYQEFLWIQLKLIKKKWWLLQALVLCMAGTAIASSGWEDYIQRGMAVSSTLFVILTIPEFWKNRSCRSMEIEETAYYSLRQIYAARILLFGMADILLLTLFCSTAVLALHFPFEQLLVQFLLPAAVTSCICFGTLGNRRRINETSAVILSILWSALWLPVTLNEKIYTLITLPLWLGFLGTALLFLAFTISRTLTRCGEYWETA